MKGIIDTTQPIHEYKVLMSELLGYYITIHASSPEEAREYANNPEIRKNYNKSGIVVVETSPVSAELIPKQELPSD